MWRPAALLWMAAVVATAAPAQAQSQPRIWDIPFGTHVRELPALEFVEPACGTQGGPPGLRLDLFDDFRRCAREASGLREVAFIYDDLIEYVARARQNAAARDANRATAVLGQPVNLSYLVNGDGRVEGYRISTDPRADAEKRMEAYMLSVHLMGRFGEEWACTDLPRREGEKPVGGIFVKERCTFDGDGVHAAVEARHYYKPGQQQINPHNQLPMVNEFESYSSLEVLYAGPALPLPPPDEGAGDGAPQAYDDPRAAFLAGQAIDCPACDLAGVDLRRRDFSGANLAGADLEGAVLHRAVLRGANLEGANLLGANLNKADLTQANLRGADLTTAMLFEADAARADFTGADFIHAYMGKARLSLANLSETTLILAQMQETRLTDANLSGSRLHGASLYKAVLYRADLSGVEAEEIDLREAALRGANLRGAMFHAGNLLRADLSEADLTRTDFSRANLLSANLFGSIQEGTVFSGATMPDNSVHP